MINRWWLLAAAVFLSGCRDEPVTSTGFLLDDPDGGIKARLIAASVVSEFQATPSKHRIAEPWPLVDGDVVCVVIEQARVSEQPAVWLQRVECGNRAFVYAIATDRAADFPQDQGEICWVLKRLAQQMPAGTALSWWTQRGDVAALRSPCAS